MNLKCMIGWHIWNVNEKQDLRLCVRCGRPEKFNFMKGEWKELK